MRKGKENIMTVHSNEQKGWWGKADTISSVFKSNQSILWKGPNMQYKHGSSGKLSKTGRSGWYLVQLRPNCLKIAERNLTRQGFDFFCPRYETTRRYRNVFRETVAPLFAGYIFCHIGNEPLAFRAVNSTYGVSRLVRFGNSYPSPVPEKFISGLRDRCDANGYLQKIEDMKVGDRIRIKAGPFADFITTVETIQDDTRVFVLLDLLGQAVKAELVKQDVEIIA